MNTMVDTTTPVTPPAQDLQINLEEAPKTEIQPSTSDLSPDTNGSLDLDLDLADAPKDDDRLKTEDQKNAIPVVETPAPEATTEIQAQPMIQEQEIIPEVLPTNEPIGEKKLEDIFAPREDTLPEIPTIEQSSSEMTEDLLDLSTTVGKGGNEGGFVAEAIQPEQTIEQATEITVPTAPIAETSLEITPEEIATPAPVAEMPVIEEISTPATVMENIPLAPEKLPQGSENNIPQASSLKNDMDMINELE